MTDAGNHILIVDDNEAFRELTAYQIEHLGHATATAANGEEALAAIGASRPMLVLLDAMMPGMDGFEVLQRLRDDQATQTLPVIMLTALGERERRIQGLRAGADGYLTKPVHEVELEAKITALLKLQQAHQALEQQRADFLAMLIHDMRSPLTSLGMFLEMLAEELPGPLNEEQQDMVAACRRGTSRILELVNNVLDFSKLSAGQLRPEIGPIAIGDLLAEPLESAAALAKGREVALEQKVAGAETEVLADASLIGQVITNLLDNGIKATEAGGTVTLSTETESDICRFLVADTGRGIAADELPHIFEPYRQARNHGTGSGLGLTISRLIAEAHQTELQVTSAPGKGSVFTFTLPLAR